MKTLKILVTTALSLAVAIAVADSSAHAAPKKCDKLTEKKNVTAVALGGTAKGCTKKTKATAGVNLLSKMSGANTCFVCHSKTGISPYNQMANNIFDQGLDLNPANIVTAYANKVGEMTGAPASLSLADAKKIKDALLTTKAQ